MVIDQGVHGPHVDGELESSPSRRIPAGALTASAHFWVSPSRRMALEPVRPPVCTSRSAGPANRYPPISDSCSSTSSRLRPNRQNARAPRSRRSKSTQPGTTSTTAKNSRSAWRVGHGLDPVSEGSFELRHGDPLGVLLRPAHRRDQLGAELVTGEHPPPQPVKQPLIDRLDPATMRSQRANRSLRSAHCETGGVDQGASVVAHGR